MGIEFFSEMMSRYYELLTNPILPQAKGCACPNVDMGAETQKRHKGGQRAGKAHGADQPVEGEFLSASVRIALQTLQVHVAGRRADVVGEVA